MLPNAWESVSPLPFSAGHSGSVRTNLADHTSQEEANHKPRRQTSTSPRTASGCMPAFKTSLTAP
eukprot:6958724-Alexandrium_andersonii.AAC.1